MTSSEEKKCLNCEFTAPVTDWKVFEEGHPFNVLCYECRAMYCKVCKYSGRVSTWRYEENGVSGKRCPSCADGTYRKCTRCDNAGPLREWTFKPDGTPTTWCTRCLDWARKKDKKIRDEKRETHMSNIEARHKAKWEGVVVSDNNVWKKASEKCQLEAGIDFVKRDAIQARQSERRAKNYSECPDCHKPLYIKSISGHQAKACKARPDEVPPLVEHCEMAALLLYNGYATLID